MSSTLRRDQTRLTQQRVLEATRCLLGEVGYTAATITAIAERASVSVPTVYRVFGNKSALVKRLYDVTLAGDDADVPMVERVEYQAILQASTLDEKLARYADLASSVASRLGSIMSPLLGAAQAGDNDLRAFVEAIEKERLAGMRIFAQSLVQFGVDARYATDILWVLTSHDLHQRLVRERGWSETHFRDWLYATLSQQLLPGPPPFPGSREFDGTRTIA